MPLFVDRADGLCARLQQPMPKNCEINIRRSGSAGAPLALSELAQSETSRPTSVVSHALKEGICS